MSRKITFVKVDKSKLQIEVDLHNHARFQSYLQSFNRPLKYKYGEHFTFESFRKNNKNTGALFTFLKIEYFENALKLIETINAEIEKAKTMPTITYAKNQVDVNKGLTNRFGRLFGYASNHQGWCSRNAFMDYAENHYSFSFVKLSNSKQKSMNDDFILVAFKKDFKNNAGNQAKVFICPIHTILRADLHDFGMEKPNTIWEYLEAVSVKTFEPGEMDKYVKAKTLVIKYAIDDCPYA